MLFQPSSSFSGIVQIYGFTLVTDYKKGLQVSTIECAHFRPLKQKKKFKNRICQLNQMHLRIEYINHYVYNYIQVPK